jgi:nitrogenase molybdenum-cofactor synthesis protein NifE
MNREPFYLTAADAVRLGPDYLPKEALPAASLIYSSPATLSYNSPGANGFGVKRAALVMPESVMLLVSPGCCGRNSTILSRESGYAERMFYLNMDETDLVMSRHLKKIPQAVSEIIEVPEVRPKVVFVCLTCVDALLGTDLVSICKKAEEQTGVRVIPCYMYALTREGTKPPMALIRDTLYGELTRRKVDPHAVNLMGYFAPLVDDSELYPMFRAAGLTHIREISRCGTYEEFLEMGCANFNLVLNPEADFAAQHLLERTGMPYIDLSRSYSISRIAKQYELLGAAIGVSFDDRKYREEARERLDAFRSCHPSLNFALGQMQNANPFELAASLLACGYAVSEIFASYTRTDLPYLREIARYSPDTRIYFGTSPSMINYCSGAGADVAVGRDAPWYEPEAVPVGFCSDIQPFGYRGLIRFLDEMEGAL